ncbi:DUF2142 domain-containing protein [Nocardioides sp. HDW12B]|uniref:DUF2142 domain-containing protein n=1 Tax=Nocardioides sp. HDW12B TaxID=2714939 RepID=UPI00140B273F|nr:DUF2142 domain-containing protein [Nocardioides sp. HDW12B]QIK66060.1 DUF2142 domain-containing protein [Nocardioides sp. HDW12B]
MIDDRSVQQRSEGRTGRSRTPSIRLMAAGLLVLQAVWILAVPPFRASDEFDHVYRSAAVARGDIRADPSDATRGTGALVTVPDDIVRAAYPECKRLGYTDEADCVGTERSEGTEVATGAGRYHPLFYALVGVPALPFDGATALYVMRIAGALLCWGLIVLALVALRSTARTGWPYLGAALACSPVMVFSASMAAPNGLEMAAGLGLWAALLGLVRDDVVPRKSQLLLIGTLSASVLVTVRSLGPLWALLILGAVLLSVPDRRAAFRRLVTDRAVLAAAGVVLVVTLLSLAWIVSSSSLTIGKVPDDLGMSMGEKTEALVKSLVAWTFQSIGAFPYRNVPAPMAVYAFYLLVVVWFVILAYRFGVRSERLAVSVVMALALLVPLGLTISTFDEYGIAWQGRYTIPFSLGFLMLCGAALDRASASLWGPAALIAAVLYALAQALSPAVTAAREIPESPGIANGDWILVSPWVLGAVAGLAAYLMWHAAAQPTSGPLLRRRDARADS